MKRLASLSAFFPAYNEEGNVKRMVDALKTVLPQVAMVLRSLWSTMEAWIRLERSRID
jgi:hypothetical protein